MDYQYYISAWIYKVLKEADTEYATFLHEQGYGKDESHLYKLFCFDRLNFGKPKLWKEKKLFQIFNDRIFLKVSFDVDEGAVNFIQGLFLDQRFYLGDKFNGIDFSVIGVNVLPEPDFSAIVETVADENHSVVEDADDTKKTLESGDFIVCVKYRTVTPWVVSYKEKTDLYAKYLRPEHQMFVPCVIKHLTEKYNSLHEDQVSDSDIHMEVSQDYKRSGFLIKPGSKNETRVVGILCNFAFTAPVKIHKMIWSAGLCEKSSLGFGWVELK
ncbi:MAG: hypothetical protein JJE17_03130 [Peptostreptococcaceae bacterium]|nr:hypothetical protein [Peptostreptococcaceae bacterium]